MTSLLKSVNNGLDEGILDGLKDKVKGIAAGVKDTANKRGIALLTAEQNRPATKPWGDTALPSAKAVIVAQLKDGSGTHVYVPTSNAPLYLQKNGPVQLAEELAADKSPEQIKSLVKTFALGTTLVTSEYAIILICNPKIYKQFEDYPSAKSLAEVLSFKNYQMIVRPAAYNKWVTSLPRDSTLSAEEPDSLDPKILHSHPSGLVKAAANEHQKKIDHDAGQDERDIADLEAKKERVKRRAAAALGDTQTTDQIKGILAVSHQAPHAAQQIKNIMGTKSIADLVSALETISAGALTNKDRQFFTDVITNLRNLMSSGAAREGPGSRRG